MINSVISGYYRKFCRNFFVITKLLTKLLRKNEPFVWPSNCQQTFEKIKCMLVSQPVLYFGKPMVDASDVGCGVELLQEDDCEIDYLVSYCWFNSHQKNYLTSEKETLALITALQHFCIYVFGWSCHRSTGVHRS